MKVKKIKIELYKPIESPLQDMVKGKDLIYNTNIDVKPILYKLIPLPQESNLSGLYLIPDPLIKSYKQK